MAQILNISGSPVTDRGISKLAEYVDRNLPEFTLIIGCKPFVYDVDAVLIGKGNIYAIECKDWKGKITGGTYGWWQKDGQVIENPLQQARNNAAALGKWLRGKIPGDNKIWVKSILVFTHEEGELQLNLDKDSNSSVAVCQLNILKENVQKQKSSIDSETINSTVQWFCSLMNKNNDKSDLGKEVFIAIVISAIVLIIFGLYSLFYIGLFNAFYFFLVRPSVTRNKFNKKYNNLNADDSCSVSGLSDDHLASRRYTDGS
jgi:hypothetical protein